MSNKPMADFTMVASDDAVEPVQMALTLIGIGRFQFRLLIVLGLVWAADAMQVLSIGLSAPGVASSFDIVIPIALQTGTAFFLGMMVGAPAFGRLADRFGRRRIFLLTVASDAMFGMLAATAPTFKLLLLCRFLTGCAVGGTLPVDYAVMAEFMPSQARGRWLVGLEAFWAIGAVAVALLAWLLQFLVPANAWRWLLACSSLPALVGLWFRISIPESPLFLLKTGRADAAQRILQQIAVMNGSHAVVRLREISPGAAATRVGLLDPGLRRRTFLIAATWLLVSVSYYGIFTWLTARLAAAGFGFVRGYGFLVLTALAQLPGYALAAFGVERWGRRPTLIAMIVVSAAGCLAFAIVETPVAIAVAILAMSFALVGTFGALYAFTPEIYPTRVRATGMGTAGAAARVGGFLASTAIAPIATKSLPLASALFAGCLVLAALAIMLIDVETTSQPLR